MPPKRVSIAPGTKTDTSKVNAGKTVPKFGSKTSLKEENINPVQRSRENLKRSTDLRYQRDKHANIIAEERYEREKEIRELQEKIQYYKRENDKIIRQQKLQFGGLSLDGMKSIKEQLGQARTTNDILYREVEARKEECEKLEKTTENVLHKINECVIEISDMKREQRVHDTEFNKIQRMQEQMQRITHYNLEMRNQLLKHKINPNTDASKLKHVASKSPLTHRNESFQSGVKLPVILDRQSLVSFRSMEDLRPARKPKLPLKRTRSYTKRYNSLQEAFRGKDSRLVTSAKEVQVFV